MSILADFLSDVQHSAAPEPGAAPSVAFSGIRGGTVRLKPILKKVADASAVSFSPSPLASPVNEGQAPLPFAAGMPEPSPVKNTRKLRFSSDPPTMDRPGGDQLIPRPFADFGDRRLSSSPGFSAPHGVDGDLSPYAQRTVDRYRGNVTRVLGAQSPLLDRSHYHHYQSRLSPTSRVSRHNPTDEVFEPVVKRSINELHEGQIALLDAHVQQHLRHCEALLGISSSPTERNSSAGGGDPSGKGVLVSQLASKLQRVTTEARWEHHRKESERKDEAAAARTSPKQRSRNTNNKHEPARFVAGGNCHPLDPPKPPTGAELIQRKREQREAIAALERLEHDPEVKRQARVLQALQECERKAEQYRHLIEEHEAERAQRNRGLAGSKTTPSELIALWRKEAENVAEDDEMEERRDYARSQRKALRLEREEKRRAEDILSGLTSLQLEEKRRKEVEKRGQPKKKRWRITKLGSVDAFAVPRWSSIPLVTLHGDVVVEEQESVVIQNVTWIGTAQGWIPVQVAFNGMSRAQLFAESAENEGTGVVTAMLDELDDAHEKILDAMTICPPEQLKSQAEVKEQLKQMEFVRQSIRDLPGGRRDMIRRIWDDIQGKGGATRRLLDAAGERDEDVM